MEKMEALTTKIDSQFKDFKGEMQEMREGCNSYRGPHPSSECDDRPMGGPKGEKANYAHGGHRGGGYQGNYYGQYPVSNKEDTSYPEEGNMPYSSYMEIKYSGRYQTWSLLQEIPNTSYPRLWIRRIDHKSQFSEEKKSKRGLRKKYRLSLKNDMPIRVLFYNGLDVPTRQILDSRGAIPSKIVADAKVAIQEMVEYSQQLHNGTSRTRSTETYDVLATKQAQLNNHRREIKKVREKVDAAQVGCEQCKGGGYRATTPGFYQRNNANPSYQERRQSMEDTLSKFMSESAKRHKENSNLIKDIRASTDAAIKNQGASIKTLEIQIGQISKVLQEREFGSLPSSTETNPRDHVKSISTIVEPDASSIRRIGSHQYAVSTGQNNTLMYETREMTISFPCRLNDCYYEEKRGSYEPQFSKAYSYGASHINKSKPQKEKDQGSFTLPCYINNAFFNNALAELGASPPTPPPLPSPHHHKHQPPLPSTAGTTKTAALPLPQSPLSPPRLPHHHRSPTTLDRSTITTPLPTTTARPTPPLHHQQPAATFMAAHNRKPPPSPWQQPLPPTVTTMAAAAANNTTPPPTGSASL
uniref:Reverse transcriptase domain-containing protein n=1 Tax=Tanacetum cinerariifolium TaxID=118510 RepID=A0A6L2LLY0_TANCI|nr:reverse transcriptase domain-containing protein [Tanacetum cinerariifolium]